MHTIGVDIGATKTNFVLLKDHRVLGAQKVLTPKSRKDIVSLLKMYIQKCTEIGSSRHIKGIGIGVPGPLNEKGDLILNPPNLKILRNCPLARIVEKELKIKTKMDNDGNCFALGEALLGAGRGAKIIFGITLGTGVGGGIVIDGKAHRGGFGSAAEVGHMTIKFDGPRCSCGSYGCLEEYVSERFFFGRGALPQKFQERAERGDKKALKVYDEYGRYLGIGLANVINLLDPEVVVIGGGIANSYKFFLKETKKEIKKRVLSPISKKYVKIKRAALGEFSGAIGAALLSQYG